MYHTSCEELTHWKRLWCWEGLGAGGEGDDRGWDGWMASLTRWMWIWVNSGSWWWTGRPGVLRYLGLQRVRHDWATELNWTESLYNIVLVLPYTNMNPPRVSGLKFRSLIHFEFIFVYGLRKCSSLTIFILQCCLIVVL